MIDIREMTLGDIDAVFEIEKNNFCTPWSKESIAKEIQQNKLAYYFVATLDNTIVGYCGMWHIITEGHITNIAVREDMQNTGIGNKLILKLIDFGVQKAMIGITLEVKTTNKRAFNLYKKNGFIIEGIRKNYYAETKEDAIVMWKYFNY
jgi:[ribosomal protein S18]-alanine N-acetyltransferase